MFETHYPAPVTVEYSPSRNPSHCSHLRLKKERWRAHGVSVVSFPLLLTFLLARTQISQKGKGESYHLFICLLDSVTAVDSMAGEAIVSGASHPEVVNPPPAGRRGVDSEVNDLTLKLKSLALEKCDLLRENGETKKRVGELMAEIEKLRSGEADKEVARLRRAAEEKGRIIQGLEREAEGIKIGMAENDAKARELERKMGAFESREIALTREKSMAKKEGRAKVEEKERVISGLREKVGDLEASLAKVASALRSSEKETGAADIASWESKWKAKEMESKLVELQRKLEHEEKVITGLKDKTAETINGRREIFDEIKEKGSKLQWPVVAAGTAGAIVVAAAVAYVRYSRRQS